MAWIGSDGSEGKEGIDNGPRLMAMASTGFLANRLPTPPLPVTRRHFSLELDDLVRQPNPDTQEASDDYWQQVHNMGMIDSVTSRLNGATTIIVIAASREEMKSIVESDPIISGGHYDSVRITELPATKPLGEAAV